MRSELIHIFLQIILEMLPVSSSGHVALLVPLLTHNSVCGVYHETVSFVLHGPAVIVVLLYFFKQWLELLYDFFSGESYAMRLALFCCVADTLTVMFYMTLRPFAEHVIPLWLGFCIAGCLLYSLRWVSSLKEAQPTLARALVVGCAQGAAFLPGISRFGATFVAARWVGFSRDQSFEYSFLLALPLMGAGFLKGTVQLVQTDCFEQLLRVNNSFSIVIATIISWYVFCWIAQVVKKGNITHFCWWVWLLSLIAFLL